MLNILIVDDEAPIRDWVEYCLKREKEKYFIAGLAKSGEEACDMVKGQKPDVIITDICMPGMNGLELMKKVREQLPYAEFIILTNYAEFSYAKEAISYGAREYLLKSEMRAEDLIRILKRIAEEKEMIVKSKKEQRLPNGFVDFYDLYQAGEEKERNVFLDNLKIQDGIPYVIFCICGEMQDKTAEEMMVLVEGEGLGLCVPASRSQYLFLIVQDGRTRKLETAVKRIAEKLYELYGCVAGISRQMTDLVSFMDCLKQAVTACDYRFFSENQRMFEYEELMALRELNFEKVREDYHEIQMNLTYKQYEEALVNLDNWFSMMKDIRIQDSEWAMERCRRLLLMVEEQCYHLDPSGEEKAKKNSQPESAKKCWEQCVILIKKLFDKKYDTCSESIEQALNYIHQNYNRDISLVDVAGVIFRSPEYFSRLFKEEVGENFSTYLMLYRLNHAKELLKKTDMKVAEVSYAVGYSTQSYFSRLYKKYMGKTPEEERTKKKINNRIKQREYQS